MEPESDEIRVERMRIIVVLPAPFGPSRARIVPSSTVRLTLSSTRLLPNDLHTSLATIPGVLVWPVIVFCPLDGDPVRRGAGRRHAAPPAVPSTPSPSREDAPLGNRRTRPTPTRSLAVRAGRRLGGEDPLGPARPALGTRTCRNPSPGATTCRCAPGPSARPRPGIAG